MSMYDKEGELQKSYALYSVLRQLDSPQMKADKGELRSVLFDLQYWREETWRSDSNFAKAAGNPGQCDYFVAGIPVDVNHLLARHGPRPGKKTDAERSV